MLPDIGSWRPWTEPAALSANRLPAHVPLRHFATLDEARRARWDEAPGRVDLNGRWAFRRFDHPDLVEPEHVVGSLDSAWGRVEVPGTWTLQGFGDAPHYTNIKMPFPGPPPRLPEVNPTGVHRRRFTVPSGWANRQVVLHVGGAESVHAVWVNGTFAGYGTDSKLPSEYDVTDLVQRGRPNELAIVVVRYSAQSYVEDQDQWWFAGLHRDVWLEQRPAVHVGDVQIGADWSEQGGRLDLRVRAERADSGALELGWQVRVRVDDARGRPVAVDWDGVGRGPTTKGAVAGVASDPAPYVFTGHWAECGGVVHSARPWSAERPERYRVLVELVDPGGAVVDVVDQMIGFRHVEVRDRSLLVNGQRVMIRGVNRHDHDPVRGCTVDVDAMRADLVAMKRHNINAVRAAHYPNDHRFLDLCDELGMYVVDEANLEAHAYNTSLCTDPAYGPTWMARVSRMVERDRNHPSIIVWSLGNESGYGPHHDAVAAWVRRTDPSRPLHYEGAIFHAGWTDGGRGVTDVVCPMYAPIWAVEHYGRSGAGERPLIMCEYNHAMGNSNGSLADYWEVFERTPGLQGGFIWEWRDHGLRQRIPGSREWRFAYGGQFGDEPHDGNFVADGLMASDLVAHPAMREVAWVHRPVRVGLAKPTRLGLRVSNAQWFTDLGWLRATWTLRIDGSEVARGGLRLPGAVGPQSSVTVPWPDAVRSALGSAPPGSEAHLSVRWVTQRELPWAPAGHLVAWDEVEVPSHVAPAGILPPYPPSPTPPSPPPSTGFDIDSIRLRDRIDIESPEGGGGEGVGAGSAEGATRLEDLVRFLWRGSGAASTAPSLWRAPTDNDGFKLMQLEHGGGQALKKWLDAGLPDRLPDGVTHRVSVEQLGPAARIEDHRFNLPDHLADVARVGVTFAVDPVFTHVRWFGRGPHENYPDRRASTLTAIWAGEPDESPYLVPQDFGLRTDCRWFELLAPADTLALRITPLTPRRVNCSATWHTDDDLYRAAHHHELTRRDHLTVHVDAATRGLGTASCGPDVLEPYRLRAGAWRLRFRLELRHLV